MTIRERFEKVKRWDYDGFYPPEESSTGRFMDPDEVIALAGQIDKEVEAMNDKIRSLESQLESAIQDADE